MNTAAKGRRFEYVIRNLFRHSGYVVSRCAASKPWDLTAANTRAAYAIECKSSQMSINAATQEYEKLVTKLRIKQKQEDGTIKLVPCLLAPILFFSDKLGNVAMLTNAYIVDVRGVGWRPFFDGEKITEVLAIGPNT